MRRQSIASTAMTAVTFDTLKFFERLKAAGVSEQ
jgi:hypothetical protein